MPHHNLFNEIEQFDLFGFRADSFQLEQFRTHDFKTAMDGELEAVIQKHDHIQERYLAFVDYFSAWKSQQYLKHPTREFSAGSVARNAKLTSVYKMSGMDAALSVAQQKAAGQNSVVLAFDPTLSPLRVKPMSFIPGEVEIDGDLMLDDLRDAAQVALRWPVGRLGRPLHGDAISTTVFGRRVYTRNEAWIEWPTGKKVGFFNPADPDDLTNPLGYIPLVGVRLTEAPHGWYLPRLPLDLLSVQLALIIGLSDIEGIVRLKAGGREIVIGPGAGAAVQRNVVAGPEGLWALEGDADLKYEAVSIDPRIDRYIEGLELLIKLFARYRFANPDGAWSSSGITGDAKALEAEEQLQERCRQEMIWETAEHKIVEVVADIAKLGPSALDVKNPTLNIEYHYPAPRRNDLQTSQAEALAIALGQLDPVQSLAQKRGIPNDAQAVTLWENNIKRWQELLESWKVDGQLRVPPGVDSIVSDAVRGSMPGRPAPSP